jgi:hypothetical protein
MEKQRKLENILEELHQLCDGKKNVPSKLRRELEHYCRKRYLFDIIHLFLSKNFHSSAIEVVSESFLNGDKELGILFLFAFLHQDDPEELIFGDSEFFGLELDNFDAHLYVIIAKYIMKLDLPSNEFKTVCEYFLRRTVANLFISDVWYGTGDIRDEWNTDHFYKRLLVNKLDFEKDKIQFTLDSVKRVTSLIAQKFHEHNLKELELTYDDSYLSIENEFSRSFHKTETYYGSKNKFITWQKSQKILPECYWLIRYGLIIPEEGLLIPNYENLFLAHNEAEVIIRTNYGFLDLTQAVHALKSILVENHLEHANDYIDYKSFNKFKKAYWAWHEELGLLNDLKERVASLVS